MNDITNFTNNSVLAQAAYANLDENQSPDEYRDALVNSAQPMTEAQAQAFVDRFEFEQKRGRNYF